MSTAVKLEPFDGPDLHAGDSDNIHGSIYPQAIRNSLYPHRTVSPIDASRRSIAPVLMLHNTHLRVTVPRSAIRRTRWPDEHLVACVVP